MAAKRRTRGAPVIGAVLEATIEELSRVGYSGLSFDAIAARAGVNKTTIYRRWPSRPALVQAALQSMTVIPAPLRDRGSLREDLLAVAREVRDSLQSVAGQSLVRLALSGPLEPELLEIMMTITQAQNAGWALAIERARARGELARGVDANVLLEALGGALIHHILLARRPADERFLAQLVDLLVAGATS